MKLSIIVLTHNRRIALRECLTRIIANTREKDTELIIIDNSSSDDTVEWLRAQMVINGPGHLKQDRDPLYRLGWLPTILWPLPTNEGVCARNHAIDIARGDFIAQVDDDVMVAPRWDEILLQPFYDDRIGAAGQEGFYQEQSWGRTPWSAGLIDDRRRPGPRQFCDFVMGYCWAWRNVQDPVPAYETSFGWKPHFRYDEAFNPFWHEESDLQLQIRAAGLRIACTSPVAVHSSLPHTRDRTEDLMLAERNFELLKKKWATDPRIRYEGWEVGLV